MSSSSPSHQQRPLAQIDFRTPPMPIDGQCHCGNVKFRVQQLTSAGLASAAMCNCTICSMHGVVTVSVALDNFVLLSGQEHLNVYQFNTNVAKHYFCSRCGIYTHHQCRSDPSVFAVNVGCLHGISAFDFKEIPILDAKHFHPKDCQDKWKWLGKWKFEALDSE